MSKPRDPLPQMLPGTVHVQYRTCGKPTCKCASGRRSDAHRAHYRFWREDGRLRKQYVKPEDVPSTTAACKARQRHEAYQRAQSRRSKSEAARVDRLLRQIEARTRP